MGRYTRRRAVVGAAIPVAPLIVGLVAIGLVGTQTSMPLSVIGFGALYAIGSLFVGSLMGFLFGVPRALTSTGTDGARSEVAPGSRFAGNTNLEQISDWLTKIIVGVTLTQLGPIRDAAGELFGAMAPSLGGGQTGAPFGGAIVVSFAISGFICGWLLTRLLLGQALAAADIALDLIDSADRAEEAGETARAHVLTYSVARLPISWARSHHLQHATTVFDRPRHRGAIGLERWTIWSPAADHLLRPTRCLRMLP